jgi:hypothetical protein
VADCTDAPVACARARPRCDGLRRRPDGFDSQGRRLLAVDIADRARNQCIERKDGRTETVIDLPPGDPVATPTPMAPDGRQATAVAGKPLPFQVNGR